VLIGAPNIENARHESDDDKSATKPVLWFNFVVFSPSVFIIFPPPRSAPAEITRDTAKTGKMRADVSFIFDCE
jgi:hypothetical protein